MPSIYSSTNDEFELFFSLHIKVNCFRIWLIQQRIPSLLAHLNCRVHTRLPALNPKDPLILPFLHSSIFIELIHNEGYYIVSFFAFSITDWRCFVFSLFMSLILINY